MRFIASHLLLMLLMGSGIKAKAENGELTIVIPKLESPIVPEVQALHPMSACPGINREAKGPVCRTP